MLYATIDLQNHRLKLIRRLAQCSIILRALRAVFLVQQEAIRFYGIAYTQLYKNGLKFLWRYMVRDMETVQKIKLLHSHYDLANRVLPISLKRSIIDSSVSLLELQPMMARHAIALSLPENTLYEGNFLLRYTFDSQELFRMTFSFTEGEVIGLNCGPVLLIGGSQGTSSTAHLIRAAAKENQEICPSVVTLLALQALASELGLSALVGISARQHVSEGVWKNPELHQSTYDDFWLAHGAVLKNGFFQLGIQPHLKDLSLVKSTHRRRARLRQQNRLDLFEAIRNNLRNFMTSKNLAEMA